MVRENTSDAGLTAQYIRVPNSVASNVLCYIMQRKGNALQTDARYSIEARHPRLKARFSGCYGFAYGSI
jgi:hypothetical protein